MPISGPVCPQRSALYRAFKTWLLLHICSQECLLHGAACVCCCVLTKSGGSICSFGMLDYYHVLAYMKEHWTWTCHESKRIGCQAMVVHDEVADGAPHNGARNTKNAP